MSASGGNARPTANDMEELVTTEQAERVIRLLAIALPVAGLALGLIAGAVRKRAGSDALLGLLCGLSGPLIWALWRVYNGVTGKFGLDSVKGLLINLTLFVAVGLAIGVLAGLVGKKLGKQTV